MNKCIELSELISVYADGELASSDMHLVEEHLATCKACSALLAFYREISIASEESNVDAPKALCIGVMNRIHGERANQAANEKKRKRGFRLILTRYAPIAACLVVMLLVWQFWGNMQGNRLDAIAPAAAPMPDMAEPAPASEDATYGFDAAPAPEAADWDGFEDEEESNLVRGVMPELMDAPNDLMLQDVERTEEEAEQIMLFIENAAALITFTGDLPQLLTEYEPEPFGSWLGWEMVFEIPNDKVPALLAEVGNREDLTISEHDNDSTYTLVMFSHD